MARNLFSDRGEATRALDELSRRSLNYDVADPNGFTVEGGWRIDDYHQALPAEQPGPPAADGAWATAPGLLRDYEFIDPSIVRALFRSDEPLERRNMLLELRFGGLRFHVGVRVDRRNGRHAHGGRSSRGGVGWSYRTLEGHLEAGQTDYEVRKRLDTGDVEFRVHAYSRAADIPNPLVRLGFHLFGRREQTRFARNSCERMRRLAEEELAAGRDRPRAADEGGLVVRPTCAGGELTR